MNKEIQIFDAWSNDELRPLGILYVNVSKGRESYSFQYKKSYLEGNHPQILDPRLSFYEGHQYPPDGTLWGIFEDASPDRWGRTLMKRREMELAKIENRRPKELHASDFLLGVYDEGRVGGLRFSIDGGNTFLSNDDSVAVPPWTSLRELEHASLQLETKDYASRKKWLSMLIAPGSSLGGARPKATVKDIEGSLWIAKFPSRHDEYDFGAWEFVVHELANLCGIIVPPAKLLRFSQFGSTFLSKRFDRNGKKRIHFASAMTLLGKHDNDHEASYLDIAEVIQSVCRNSQEECRELWKRMAFNIFVSNTDDHLRNHGFILQNNAWQLSPAYDINPNPMGNYLSLSVNYETNVLDIEAAIKTADYFLMSSDEATQLAKSMASTITQNWIRLAQKLNLGRASIEDMRFAFMNAEHFPH